MGKENQTDPKRLAAMLVMIIAVVLAAGISCHRTWKRLGNRETPEESQPVLLRLAETMPEDHPSARASALFAQLVDERSNGRVKIRVYYNSELGSPDEVMEQLKFGGVGLARVSSLELSDLDSGLREQMMPARFASRDQQMEWFWEHQEELKQLCEKDNMVPLVWYYPDRRCFYSSRMDIADASSLEGKNFNVQVKVGKANTNVSTTSRAFNFMAESVRRNVENEHQKIECSEDGIRYRQMRICHMWEGAGKIQFGIYACSPENSSFKAVFTEMKLTECQWKAHDGQKPDEI